MGFCGGLTTFSAFEVQTLELARNGHLALAVGYPLASIAGAVARYRVGAAVAAWVGGDIDTRPTRS
jgi:CrcB protein